MTFTITRQEYDRHSPRPEHPEHGPVLCPDIILWKFVDLVPQCCPGRCSRCAPLRVQVATMNPWAAWEPSDSEQNTQQWREAEAMVAALNAGWASLYKADQPMEN